MGVRIVATGAAVLVAFAAPFACVSLDGLTGGTRDAGPDQVEVGPVEAGDAGGEAEAAPAPPTLLVGGLPYPSCVAVDLTHLYWATKQCGGGQMCASEQSLAGDAGPMVIAMAPDDYGVGWTDCAVLADGTMVVGGTTTNGLIDTFPPGATVEARFAYGFAPVVALAVSPSGGIAWTTKNGWVYACGSTCDNNPVTIAAAQNTPGGIATDGVTVYWTNLGDGTIASSPFDGDGGQVSVVAGDAASPADIAVDGTGVYWVETTSGNVVALPSGAAKPVILASGPAGATAIALDGARIYWVSSAGTVMRVEKDGGGATTLASGQANPVDVAVDSRWVYWADGVVDGGIYRVAK